MAGTEKENESNVHKANLRGAAELLMELINKSGRFITESSKWTMRSVYVSFAFCGVSAAVLIGAAIVGHVTNNPRLLEIFGSIALFCQIFLLIWWAFFWYFAKTDIAETQKWWNQNIKPLKDRDPTFLLK